MMISKLSTVFWFTSGAVHITLHADGSLTQEGSFNHSLVSDGCSYVGSLDGKGQEKCVSTSGCTLLGNPFACLGSCPCGRPCTQDVGHGVIKGTCQADEETCADNIVKPNCDLSEQWPKHFTARNGKEKVFKSCLDIGIDKKWKRNACVQLGCTVLGDSCADKDKFNCFSKEVWKAEKEEWCCKVKRIGCPTKCPPVCALHCPHGNVMDENGCPICKCKEPPAEEFNCKTREVWTAEKKDWCCKEQGFGCEPGVSCDTQTFLPATKPREYDCYPPPCARPPAGCEYPHMTYTVSPSGTNCCLHSCGPLVCEEPITQPPPPVLPPRDVVAKQ